MESFHAKDYLDLLEFYQSDANANVNAVQMGNKPQLTVPVRVPISVPSAYINLLDAYGLTDDCPIPMNPRDRAQLWTYCRVIAGASIQAARLL